MSAQDFRINAAVKSLIQRRWMSAEEIDFGTTNGVVYLRGSVPPDGAPSPLLAHIASEVRALPGVRDVVIGVTGWRRT